MSPVGSIEVAVARKHGEQRRSVNSIYATYPQFLKFCVGVKWCEKVEISVGRRRELGDRTWLNGTSTPLSPQMSWKKTGRLDSIELQGHPTVGRRSSINDGVEMRWRACCCVGILEGRSV